MTSPGATRPARRPAAALARPQRRGAALAPVVRVDTTPVGPAKWSRRAGSSATAALTVSPGKRVPYKRAEPEELNSARNSAPPGKPDDTGKSLEAVVPETHTLPAESAAMRV